MPGLLFSAYQKLYSALCNLDRFDKEANFFDNISCLDNFFSEYRNVTFSVQAQLKHTEHFSAYEKCKEKYHLDHWFVEKRNETIKQQPFQLVKKICLTIYFPYQGITVLEKEFSVENDAPLEALFPELKKLFSSIKDHEIFFSTSFSFHEAGSDIDLFDKLIPGVSTMLQFIAELEREIREDCQLCEQIKGKISKLNFQNLPRDFLLVNDYVYYPQLDRFERGTRFAMLMLADGKKAVKRVPLAGMTESEYYNYDGTPFGNFTFLHAVLRCIQPGLDIMSAFMLVYEDETYEIDTFQADIKTTVYRKINEVANTIKVQNVREVCFVCLYSVLPLSQNVPYISKERVNVSSSDILVCSSVDSQLNEKEYVFDGKAMEHPGYVALTMKNGMKRSLEFSRVNMFPIWRAFKERLATIKEQDESI